MLAVLSQKNFASWPTGGVGWLEKICNEICMHENLNLPSEKIISFAPASNLTFRTIYWSIHNLCDTRHKNIRMAIGNSQKYQFSLGPTAAM